MGVNYYLFSFCIMQTNQVRPKENRIDFFLRFKDELHTYV